MHSALDWHFINKDNWGMTHHCLALLFYSIQAIHCYPTGAPIQQCGNMQPSTERGHHMRPAQSPDTNPYLLEINGFSIDSGRHINVTVNSKDPEQDYLRGILIEARDSTDDIVGTFSAGLPVGFQHLACNGIAQSAVTHTESPMNKQLPVTFTWFPSENFEKDVSFKATIVKQRLTYWTNIKSKNIVLTLSSAPNDHTSGQPTQRNGITSVIMTCVIGTLAALLL